MSLALASIAATLLLTDVFLRFTGWGSPRRGTITPRPGRHALIDWIDVFPPGYSGVLESRDFKVQLRMNGLGLRERELEFDRLAADRPFLFLGDSYFFGWGVEVEDRFSERLGARLLANGPRIPEVNLSFPGWGSVHYWEAWKTFVPRLNPRLVVISCFVGNDLSDDLKQAGRLGSDSAEGTPGAPFLTPVSPSPPPTAQAFSIREWLSTSPLIGAVQHGLWLSPYLRKLLSRIELRNDRLTLYEPNSSELRDRLFRTTLQAYERIARLARERGIPVVVVLIPDHLQILQPDLFLDLDLENPQRTLTTSLEKLGFRVVDLLPAIQKAPERDRYFFRQDKHWSKDGHAFVADLLYPVVTDPGLKAPQ